MKQGDWPLKTHQIGDRDSDAEGAQNSLDHDEPGLSDSVEKSHKAKEDRSQKAVQRVSFQILPRIGNDLAVMGENACQQIAMKKGNCKHCQADAKRNHDADAQRFQSPFVPACAIVLGDKSSHGLHKGRRNQHDKGADLFSHPDSGGYKNSQRIYNRENNQE